jgi:iron complex outermembrane receptor protein
LLGPASPTGFYLGHLKQREFNLNADFVYRRPVGTVQPVNIAFGAELRRETYQVSAGDPASYAIGAGAATELAPTPTVSSGSAPAWPAPSTRTAMRAISISNGSRSRW